MSKIQAFEREPYTRELEVTVARVAEADGRLIAVLDDTLLYPEGGGQPSDRGWVSGVGIAAVEKGTGELLHILEGPIEEGPARVVLDWDRRYDHMQQHTAQHVLTRAALDQFGWATRSFHIGARVSDIELDCEPPASSMLERLEDAVARVISEARPVRSYRVSADEYRRLDVRSRGLPAGHTGDIRLVEILNFDLNTCGGTHVRSTAEIETLKVISSEALRGGCRLSWVAGKRVRSRLAAHEQRSRTLRRLLDTGDDEVLTGLQLKLDQLAQERRSRRDLQDRLAEAIVDELVHRQQDLVDVHLAGAEANLLRRIAEGYAEAADGGVAFLTANQEDGSLFVLAAGEGVRSDLRAIGQQIADLLGGRGGGSGKIFQGKSRSLEMRDEAMAILRRSIA